MAVIRHHFFKKNELHNIVVKAPHHSYQTRETLSKIVRVLIWQDLTLKFTITEGRQSQVLPVIGSFQAISIEFNIKVNRYKLKYDEILLSKCHPHSTRTCHLY